MSKATCLIVDDDAEIVRLLRAVLASLDLELTTATTIRQVLQMLDESVPAIMLLDMRLPDGEGLEVINEVRRRGAPCTILAMTAHGTVDIAVEAMRNGAHDFLTKPLDFERLKIMVRHAMERHRLIAQLDDFVTTSERLRFRFLHGSSPAMQRLYRSIQGSAHGPAPLLITGPSGSEFLATARSIHAETSSAESLLATCDLQTIPEGEQQMEALFGDHPTDDGPLARQTQGTLFLQNIHLLAKAPQERLRRWILTPKPQAPRLLTSAPESFLSAPDRIGFDSELVHLLTGILIRLTPLKDRGDDVLQLAQLFLEDEATRAGKPVRRLTDEVEEALMLHDWPENVEELQETIRTAVGQAQGISLTANHLPPAIAEAPNRQRRGPEVSDRRSEAASVIRPLWQTEREEIEKALRLCNGSVLEAARLLEVSPGTIYRKQRTWQTLSRS